MRWENLKPVHHVKQFIHNSVDLVTDKPVRFFFLAALLWAGVMSVVNYKLGIGWQEIAVEADGMFFDLLVFGILLSFYEGFREKRRKIEQFYEEIDDYRGWDEKEAIFRNVGAIRRLNKLGVSKIDLYRSFLSGADLSHADLSGADLSYADLSGADFSHADLSEADFSHADLSGADFSGCNFFEASLFEANLSGANLSGTNLLGIVVDTDIWLEVLQNKSLQGIEEVMDKYVVRKGMHPIYEDSWIIKSKCGTE